MASSKTVGKGQTKIPGFFRYEIVIDENGVPEKIDWLYRIAIAGREAQSRIDHYSAEADEAERRGDADAAASKDITLKFSNYILDVIEKFASLAGWVEQDFWGVLHSEKVSTRHRKSAFSSVSDDYHNRRQAQSQQQDGQVIQNLLNNAEDIDNDTSVEEDDRPF